MVLVKLKVMKCILYSIVVLLGFFTAACNDWLEVSPETEKDREDVYSTQDGFRDVLIGAYIRMKSNALYGEEMVCGTVEMLAQHWNNSTSGSKSEYLSKYDYKASVVESAIGNIYNNLYKVIADVNGLLEYVDRKKDVFTGKNYDLIKGEALAIRAFCHFDVLRLFGPMPDKLPVDAILPYVTKVTNVPNSKLTFSAFTTCLLEDLQEAENCLKDSDPICSNSIEKLNNLSSAADKFTGYRQMRMNYYAVCALKARVYLWLGNTGEALKYAKLLIDAKDPEGKDMYCLGNSNDCANFDYTFSSEHVLNLNVYNLSSTLGTGRGYEKDKNILTARLYDAATTDIRFKYMWEEVSGSWWEPKHFYFKKYVQSDKMPSLSKNSIPLIRLYEMYLIAMECSSLEEANELYKKMCVARDIPEVTITSKEQLKQILVLEYNKEFYGEGQAFYAYKRLAIEDIFNAQVLGAVDTYVFPLPVQETI